MGSKTTMLYLSPMETLQTAAMSWYLSHISLIISDTYSDHILCPGSLLCYVMSQITPQAKNIHCTFYGQFSQYATYVSIPILCCRQLGTRSKFGVQIPVEGVPVWASPPGQFWCPFLYHTYINGVNTSLGAGAWLAQQNHCAQPCCWPSQHWDVFSWMVYQLSLVFPLLQHSRISGWPQKTSLETQGKGSGGMKASSWKVGKVDSFFQHQSWFVLPEIIHEQTASAVYQQHE